MRSKVCSLDLRALAPLPVAAGEARARNQWREATPSPVYFADYPDSALCCAPTPPHCVLSLALFLARALSSLSLSLARSFSLYLSLSLSAEQAGVGLLLGEQKDSSIVSVKQVVPRGSADRTNRIRVGDQILRVGDVDATGMGVTDLRNLIIGEQVNKHTHTHARAHTHTHTYTHTRIHICVCLCVYMHIMYIDVTYTYILLFDVIYTHILVCVYILHIYTHVPFLHNVIIGEQGALQYIYIVIYIRRTGVSSPPNPA
jgi:hypothetical protein